jgi:4-amino-4-deoxy-L-arabinose transferase-like glycosyltransferase
MNPETPGSRSSTSLFARIGWAALIVATLYVCYFSHLGAIGFVGPDEPRYAWVARAMLESGDWVTPRLYGQPWFEKPVLYYWEAALGFKVFGVSEAAARLPSAVSALLATLVLAWLAWRLYGAETARWVLLLLPTTVGMIGFSHAAAMDMPFTGMVTIAMVCAAVALRLTPAGTTVISSSEPAVTARLQKQTSPPANRKAKVVSTPWLALILFGFFLGLAVLAKGPAGIILCGGAVFFWALFSKRWRDAFRLLHPVAIASFCLTALPWYILCASRNPDFFRVFIIEHNFNRYLTPEFHHIQPFWFYVPILLLAIVPWVVPLFAFIRDLAKRRPLNPLSDGNGAMYFACWSAFTVLFFSASRSKLPGYILPGIPPFVLLMANSVAQHLLSPSKKIRWIGIGCGLTLIGLATAFGFSLPHIPFAVDARPPNPLGGVVLVLCLAGLVAAVLGLFRRSSFALAASILALIFCLAWSLTGDARWSLDEGITAGLTGTTPAEAQARFPGRPIYSYELNRSFQYSLNFHFHQELPEWDPRADGPAWVFTSPAKIGDLRKHGLRCPAYVSYPAVVVCESFGSVDRSAGGGKLQ